MIVKLFGSRSGQIFFVTEIGPNCCKVYQQTTLVGKEFKRFLRFSDTQVLTIS